jgi:hypothetical protein
MLRMLEFKLGLRVCACSQNWTLWMPAMTMLPVDAFDLEPSSALRSTT